VTKKDMHQKRPTRRKFAEWVTLGVSVVLVLAVAAYLFLEAVKEHPAAVPVTVRVLTEEVQEVEGTFVVPVEVMNRGERTLKELTIKVTFAGGSTGGQEPGDITIDYLGEKAKERVYLYLDVHPRELRIAARPLSYQLE
jgi:uncharacterized protein (TIGR02588 family)